MNLRSLFRRKKKKKEKELSIFGEPLEEEKTESSIGFRRSLRLSLAGLKLKRKFRIPGLLKFKRILAGGLFLMYSIISVMMIPESYALLFIATSFILLDYLWKTRSIQWVQPEVENP